MVADERHTVRVVDEERVRAAVTGTKHRPQVSIAGTDDLALLQAPVDLVLLEGRLEPAPESRFLAQQPFRHAVFRQELEEERPLLRDVGAEPLEVARERLVGSEHGARSPADLRREPRVVGVVVRQRHELGSSTRNARSASPASSRDGRLRAPWPRVDERQRLPAKQPDVDGCLALQRERDPMDHAITASAARR